jgi:hypothetical protein
MGRYDGDDFVALGEPRSGGVRKQSGFEQNQQGRNVPFPQRTVLPNST